MEGRKIITKGIYLQTLHLTCYKNFLKAKLYLLLHCTQETGRFAQLFSADKSTSSKCSRQEAKSPVENIFQLI